MKRVEAALKARLIERGMKASSITAFIRNVLNTMEAEPLLSLNELNKRLRLLGWNEFWMGGYTFQLIQANYGRDFGSATQMINEVWKNPEEIAGSNDIQYRV